ncbi:MAG: DUF4012 domain-containing protein [Patescibacteria group bacterium]|jgi:hypothetical protein
MKSKKIFIINLVVISAIIIIAFVGVVYKVYQPIESINDQLPSLESDLLKLQNDIISEDFSTAEKSINNISQDLKIIHSSLDKTAWMEGIPVLRDNYVFASQIVVAGEYLIDSGKNLLPIVQELRRIVPKGNTYQQLNGRQKEAILQNLSLALPMIKDLDPKIKSSVAALQSVKQSNLVLPLEKLSKKINNFLPLINPSLQITDSLIKALPLMSGYDAPKTYLLIMQNNDELRPTGGFIGVYGIAKVRDGLLTSLSTSDSYALDKEAADYLNIEPPKPIKDFMAKKWFFRDANWYPDFPAAAEKLLWFYKQERGKENPSGVIAFDQDFVAGLLDITGPIKTKDLVFNSANFGDLLQYEVEQNYIERGLKKENRKDIVEELSTELIAKLAGLPIDKWLEILSYAQNNLIQKHVLLFDQNKNLQSIYNSNGWTGEIKQTDGDYLMFIDANMVALKTDRIVDKKINYTLREDQSGNLISIATISYTNNGKVDYRTTALRTYTRLYVPAGSELISSSGALTNDRGDDPGKTGVVDVTNEFNKTSFGAFIYIKPGETKSLIFEYKLPPRIKDQLTAGSYTLFVQKQPGTTGHKLSIRVKLGNLEKVAETDLIVDRSVKINNLSLQK